MINTKGGEGTIYVKVREKNVLYRRKSKCKGPGGDMIMVCSRKRKKVIVATRSFVMGEGMEKHEVGQVDRSQILYGKTVDDLKQTRTDLILL